MADQNQEELRGHKRVPFRQDILIDGVQRCQMTDISEGGIYISAIQHFQQGSVVQVAISFRDKSITLKGQVQYCQSGIGAGINFIDLSADQKTIIRELIDSLTKDSR
jgi:hypothetical protein